VKKYEKEKKQAKNMELLAYVCHLKCKVMVCWYVTGVMVSCHMNQKLEMLIDR
jgi:hypothetical protein